MTCFLAASHGGTVGMTMNNAQATTMVVAKRFINRHHCKRFTAQSAPITIGGTMKWVKYTVDATLSHQNTCECQNRFCNTTFGSWPKNMARSIFRGVSTCNGNLTPKIPSSATPRVDS